MSTLVKKISKTSLGKNLTWTKKKESQVEINKKRRRKKPEGYYPSNADKSPVERLSLNRSQCGGYSTKYNTLTET